VPGEAVATVGGEISADGTKVARFTSISKANPYINLENKVTGEIFTSVGRVAQPFAFFAKAGDVHSSLQSHRINHNLASCPGD
jgi:hypothetical protein